MHPKSNVHTHTVFSDGRNTAEEMVLSALDRGFVSLGFSDHGVAPHDPAAMSPEGEQRYIAEIRRLQRCYGDRIEIALGCEHDFSMPDWDLSAYSYVIESVHFLHRDGEYATIDHSAAALREAVDRLYGGDPYAMCGDYFDSVCRSIEGGRGEIIGHVGLCGKFNEGGEMFDFADPRYESRALEALKLAAERGRLVEINTGAISRGCRTVPYPEPRLLRSLREFGARILFSSDCHRAGDIDFGFDLAVRLAKAAGFRECWVWRDGAFRPAAL